MSTWRVPPTWVALPGMRWVDGHKGVFSVELTAVSSVHPQVGEWPQPRSLALGLNTFLCPGRPGLGPWT